MSNKVLQLQGCEMKGSTFQSRKFSFSGRDISADSFNFKIKSSLRSNLKTIEGQIIGTDVIFPFSELETLQIGNYTIEYWAVLNGIGTEIIAYENFRITDSPCNIDYSKENTFVLNFVNETINYEMSIAVINIGTNQNEGGNGKSAYQLALDNGFIGTEAEWLLSLVGDDGKSAYQSYLDTTSDNPKLTESQWLDSLKAVVGNVTSTANVPEMQTGVTYTQGSSFILNNNLYTVNVGQIFIGGTDSVFNTTKVKRTIKTTLDTVIKIGQNDIKSVQNPPNFILINNQPIGKNGKITRIDFAQTSVKPLTFKLAIGQIFNGKMRVIRIETLTTIVGQQFLDLDSLNLYVNDNQHFGIQTVRDTNAPSQSLFSWTTQSGNQHYNLPITSDVGSETSSLSTLGTVDYSYTLKTQSSAEDKINSMNADLYKTVYPPFYGKTIDTIGDSITWYDGQNYGQLHTEQGNKAKGYQSYIRETLGATVINSGISGANLSNMRIALVGRDFSNTDYITITGGVNDWIEGRAIGGIQPINGAHVQSQCYGAIQVMIEYILTNFPKVKIILITPIRAKKDDMGEMPSTYAEMFLAIGKLYGIPVCDWYNNLSFNLLTYNYFYKDQGALSDRRVHVGNEGYEKMGKYLVDFFNKLK